MKQKKLHLCLWFSAAGLLPMMSSCTLLGFLLSPSSSEQKIAAQFPLYAQKDKSVYLAVRASPGSRADADIPGLLQKTLAADFQRKVGVPSEKIFQMPSVLQNPSASFSWSQVEEEARRLQAAYLLSIEIVEFEAVPLGPQNYYMGSLAVRAILSEIQTGQTVWPPEKTPRLIRTAVDFEANGRSQLLYRMLSAVSHCIVRHLYPCPKNAFRVSEEMEPLESLMNQTE
ncbi:MAG TPA: hypothetical protein PK054_11830 [Anaerohalosphaeraceae bacterium]|nr:hypothetical protein [Anaerohalosphaeraceae bacterium]HOL89925.1 hypothetical protein [Anaerohalosphaeraceae bacterium]HPP57253.1 hypothetical protein [Anaerohalosphaeraceae bacterium]